MSKGRQRGFSLLEVLVAFFILALSLGVLYQAFGKGLHSLTLSGRQTRAAILAESLLHWRARLGPFQKGDVEGERDGFHWRVEVAGYAANGIHYHLFRPYRLRVTVWWEESGRNRQTQLETLQLARL